MQVLDVGGGGNATGTCVAIQSLSNHGKKWSIYENQSWNYFPILTAFKSSLQR